VISIFGRKKEWMKREGFRVAILETKALHYYTYIVIIIIAVAVALVIISYYTNIL